MKRFFLVFLCVILIIPSVFAGDAIPNKICPACGWKLNPEWPIDFAQAKFCGHCGTVLVDAPDETPAPTAAPAIQAKIGDIITFGHYEQDGDLDNGQEAIEWLVLDKKGDQVLGISKYVLDCMPYNTKFGDITWESCSLRQWLNYNFFYSAFTNTEQYNILMTTIPADNNPDFHTDPGNDTQDKIFLLSITEANSYFAPDDMRCEATQYVKKQKKQNATDFYWWWLRSPGYSQYLASYVIADGGISEYGSSADYGIGAIRPAMWISLNGNTEAEVGAPAAEEALPTLQAKIGDIITFGHYEQDGNLSNGKEEIEWIVLDQKDDQIFVISKHSLDCQPFHTSMVYVTWKTCSLRQWLNDDFFNTAFSEEEQSRIPTVALSCESNGGWKYSSYDTEDKVYLLNRTEANDYFSSNDARKCEFTAYAAQLKNATWGRTGTWWLRTPGASDGSNVAHFINDDGVAFYSNGATRNTDVDANLGVRPAMWINLNP